MPPVWTCMLLCVCTYIVYAEKRATRACWRARAVAFARTHTKKHARTVSRCVVPFWCLCARDTRRVGRAWWSQIRLSKLKWRRKREPSDDVCAKPCAQILAFPFFSYVGGWVRCLFKKSNMCVWMCVYIVCASVLWARCRCGTGEFADMQDCLCGDISCTIRWCFSYIQHYINIHS